MVNIAIDGHYLHEVKIPLVPHSEGTTSYLLYPEYRIDIIIDADKLLLTIPAFLSVELYRKAIIPQDSSKSMSIEIDGKEMGNFLVVDFRYPNSGHEPVNIIAEREK